MFYFWPGFGDKKIAKFLSITKKIKLILSSNLKKVNSKLLIK